MNVDHHPHGHVLLDEAGEYYIDVNCEKGFMGFSVLVQFSVFKHELLESG